MTTPRATGTARALRAVRAVLAWVVLIAAVGLLAAVVVVPRIAGATPYTILTGSMRPSYPPGTLVVVRPVDADRIGVGTPVTYQLGSGRPAVVTHRVVAVNEGPDGRTFTTRGDANDVPDAAPVRPVQVRGEVWYALPWVGHLWSLLPRGGHQLLVWAFGGLLAAYAAAMFVGAALDRRRRREPQESDAPVGAER